VCRPLSSLCFTGYVDLKILATVMMAKVQTTTFMIHCIFLHRRETTVLIGSLFSSVHHSCVMPSVRPKLRCVETRMQKDNV